MGMHLPQDVLEDIEITSSGELNQSIKPCQKKEEK
jgi:hypothetical protein